MNSKFLSLPNAADLVKAAFLAGVFAILMGLYNIIAPVPPAIGHFPTAWSDWQPILIAGAAGFIGALIKTSLTNSAGQLLKTEATPAAQALTAAKATTPALAGQTK
jgi:hypothetical protein